MREIAAPSDADDEVGLADWLEATMLADALSYIPRAKIRRHLKSLLHGDDADLLVETALREIERRRRICHEGYPFHQDGTGVRYEKGTGTSYLFMLCISASASYRKDARYAETDELFDSLVSDALLRYLGQGAKAVRFGSPASGARPKNFEESIAWLAKELGLPSGAGRARRHTGDGGLDVIAWHPFGDRRSAFIALLAQCTVQLDWEVKARDLGEDKWRGWIDFGKDPHLVLAIPFVVPSGHAKWDEVRRLAHTILDRLRIVELIGDGTLVKETKIKRWIAEEVRRMGIGK